MNKEGLNCCSNYTISFHYVSARNMYTMYFLTYRLKPYGIKLRHPPPPEKRRFGDVIGALELDRDSQSYRDGLTS